MIDLFEPPKIEIKGARVVRGPAGMLLRVERSLGRLGPAKNALRLARRRITYYHKDLCLPVPEMPNREAALVLEKQIWIARHEGASDSARDAAFAKIAKRLGLE